MATLPVDPEDVVTEPPVGAIAIQNLSDEYQEHVRHVMRMRENKTCKGRIVYAGYLTWDLFGNFTAFFIVLASVSVTVAIYTRSMLATKDLYLSASYAAFGGVAVGLFLVVLDMVTFWFGAFTDKKTKYRIRNYWHKGYVFSITIILLILALALYAIGRLMNSKDDDYSFSHIFLN